MNQRYLYLLLLLIVFSCSKEINEIDISPKGRTVLVYLAGDHNLSYEVADIHAALMQGWNSKIVGSLVVFADRKGASPVLIKIKQQNNKTIADTLKTYNGEGDNVNSASSEILRQVIADTQILAPGESYGMVLYSHASGWLPPHFYNNPIKWEAEFNDAPRAVSRSIFHDNGREMELADFADAIPDRMFDFIASEMCFMSSVEMAYALRNKTDYLLASAPEVLVPGFTHIYSTSLDLLFKPEADLRGFAQDFYNYFLGKTGQNRSAAISLVRTSEMESLAALTREIAPDLELNQAIINQVQYYDGTFKRDDKGYPHVFFDFRDFVSKTDVTPEQLQKLDDLLSRVVPFKLHTKEFLNIIIEENKYSGLSVYIPQENLPKLNDAYKKTEWWKAVN